MVSRAVAATCAVVIVAAVSTVGSRAAEPWWAVQFFSRAADTVSERLAPRAWGDPLLRSGLLGRKPGPPVGRSADRLPGRFDDRTGDRNPTSLIGDTPAVTAPSLTSAARIGTTPLAERWHRTVPGGWFQWSSPVIGDVGGDGHNDVIVGGQDGGVYAWDAAGNLRWRASALAPVASSPAVADLDADGVNEVVVGSGSLDPGIAGQRGGLSIFESDGRTRCHFPTLGLEGRPFMASTTAVFNAPAVGDVDGDGRNDVVFGSWDHRIYALDRDCRLLDFFDNTDTVFSAPALLDIDNDGAQEIFIGGDATRGALPHSGGYFRSLTFLSGKLVERWVRLSAETFQSAAAIGDIDDDGRLEVVTGSGSDYCRHQNRCSDDSRRVWAFHLDDGSDVAGWPKRTTFNGHFLAAPALGDIDGDGNIDVVVGTTEYTSVDHGFVAGAVNAFLGKDNLATTDPSWIVRPTHDLELLSAPVIADVDGAGPSEVILAFDGQFRIFDGTGALKGDGLGLGDRRQWLARGNAAAVGELVPGRWAVATAGWDPGSARTGYLHVYDIPPPTAVPWPQFRQSASRAGVGGRAPVASAPTPPAPAPPAPVPAPAAG